MWALEDFLVLDTETTGLSNQDEVIQIGIINKAGDVLFDSLIKPSLLVSAGAAKVHGITDDILKDAPRMDELYWQLHNILEGKDVFIYNAPFDIEKLAQSCHASDLGNLAQIFTFHDVMKPYAEFYGAWSDWHQSYTWQSLTNACHQQEIEIVDAHSAVGDCQMTLALMKKLAGI